MLKNTLTPRKYRHPNEDCFFAGCWFEENNKIAVQVHSLTKHPCKCC